MSNSINTTLNARQSTYGDYSDVAAITQSLMRIVESGASYEQMSDVQKTSLFMIANKMARIVNGDPAYDDSWHDIAGYSTLVVNDLKNAPVTPQAILDAQPSKDMPMEEKCSGEQLGSCEHYWIDAMDGGTKVCAKECGAWK